MPDLHNNYGFMHIKSLGRKLVIMSVLCPNLNKMIWLPLEKELFLIQYFYESVQRHILILPRPFISRILNYSLNDTEFFIRYELMDSTYIIHQHEMSLNGHN